ncbi:uncharacterized protein LOC127735016 [Mytilus californianus]|uniref:uncharacterized protein LOC127735016 n=1 Tax=Mytilus californianus TaxID=6549 RepID=UPI00224701CB|nr:uncharacterized protein LOC127735016 [Mytilus californianus]
MMFDKYLALKVLQKEEVLFSSKLNPVEILPHLTSMSEMSKQEIKCEQNNKGEKIATQHLLKRIRQQDKCLIEFIRALRDPEICQTDLADMLDPNHLLDTGKKWDQPAPSVPSETKAVRDTEAITPPIYNGVTQLRHLPFSVMKILQILDYNEKWKDLAEYLGYTVEEVQHLQTTPKSCTEKLIANWSSGDKPVQATVENLFNALDFMERKDIMRDLEQILNYKFKKQESEKPGLSFVAMEPVIDIQERKSHDNKETSLYDRTNMSKTPTEVGDICQSIEMDGMSLETRFSAQDDRELKLLRSANYASSHIPENNPRQETEKPNVLIQNGENDKDKKLEKQIFPDKSLPNTYHNKEPFSIENNALQSINEQKSEEISKINTTETSSSAQQQKVENTDPIIDVGNNNTKCVHKNMTDKVIDIVKSKPLVVGSVIGALSLGLIAYSRNS